MEKEKEKENEQKKTKKKQIKLSGVILFVLVSFFLIKGISLQPQIQQNKDTITELDEQIEYEKQRSEEVDKMKANVDSADYIEKVAREKLGMIKKYEIVFIDISEKEE